MKKVAISFLTKDRTDLSVQSIVPLLQPTKFDTFWIDGSVTEQGQKLPDQYPQLAGHYANIRGGAGAGIVFALTMMLEHPARYDYVGLVENDVRLGMDAITDAVVLFERGRIDGLEVGAVSARTYADRILFQRDGYAVMHNLGAGQIILTRAAAEIVLNTFRSGWTTDNRRIFVQLSGIDIGRYWAFRGGEHWLVADWNFDATLAAHGLASLALTPSPCEMIGQNPPLAKQGLTLVDRELDEFKNALAFNRYANTMSDIRDGKFMLGTQTDFHYDPTSNTWTYFAPHVHKLGGKFTGDWAFREQRGFGEFAWVAGIDHMWAEINFPKYENGVPMPRSRNPIMPALEIPIFGPACFLVSGSKNGGKFEIEDTVNGYKATPDLVPEGPQQQVLQLVVPGAVNYRTIRLTALTPGVVFFGIQTRDKQPIDPTIKFDYSTLPPVA